MKVKVKRLDYPGAEPYWQTFDYTHEHRTTVSAILDELNFRDDLFDENGEPARRIHWACSCLQKICGACTMIVNHEPVLACNCFVDTAKMPELILEPLTKFPVVTDLCVDRSCIAEYLKEAETYLGELGEVSTKEFEKQYATAKCLKCGLCLEVCPNYTGQGGNFFGAMLANESYLMHSLSGNRKKKIAQSYREHFAKGCSKSLSCRSVCPMNIPTLSSIGYMNRRK